MTVEEIRARVTEIDASADLIESAHRAEDWLYVDVLRAIAAGAPDAIQLAEAALEARELDLERYYSEPADNGRRPG